MTIARWLLKWYAEAHECFAAAVALRRAAWRIQLEFQMRASQLGDGIYWLPWLLKLGNCIRFDGCGLVPS